MGRYKKSQKKYTWKKKLVASAIKKVLKKGIKSIMTKTGTMHSGAFSAITGSATLNRFASQAIIDLIAAQAPIKQGKRSVWFTEFAQDVYSTSGTFHWVKVWAIYYKNSKRTTKIGNSKKIYLYERQGAC